MSDRAPALGLGASQVFQGVEPRQDRAECEGGHDHHGGDEDQSVLEAQVIGAPSPESEQEASESDGNVSSITALAMHRISRNTISAGL